LCNHIKFKF